MKQLFSTLVFALLAMQANAFCGFYVAKAGANLYNNKSEVILVRDGRINTLTMSNDFKGDVKDFAMVVPVPEILRERDIKIVNRSIFDKIDAYSAPRMVEYYDDEPCNTRKFKKDLYLNMVPTAKESTTYFDMEKSTGVTIEAKYSIGEYDILILSAEESGGLETWLIQNGYALPNNAKEVLQPYIKDKLKFFVVKVNLENSKNTGYNYLRPIQITYESDRFMLPIRLGMANSRGFQDLIVYAFTKAGRVECTNYRTEKMPTDNNIPTFVLNQFDSFYIKTFNRQYIRHNKNTVFLEYAWNVTPSFNGVKCDPCVGNPPMLNEFQEAGVSWLNANPTASVFFTRMHVRYSRADFPQDLMLQVTPNTEHFQARYVITHPAIDCDCSEGEKYLQKLESRKMMEVIEYCKLTGDKVYKYTWYAPSLKELEKDMGAVESVGIKQTVNDSDELNRLENKATIGLMAIEEGEKAKRQMEPLLLLLFPLSLLLYALFQKRKAKV